MITARSQPPLPPEQRPERPARLSQTWLGHFQRCRRSALLYLKYGGGAASPAMERGSLFHATVARLTEDALDHGWTTVPQEIAKAALFELYAEGEFTVPASEWDFVRRCVYNWAEHTRLEPQQILGVEQLMVWDVGGWRISGKIDLAWRDGRTVAVRDYKSSLAVLTKEEFEQSFQVKLYSLLASYGHPVTVSGCECNGTGKQLTDMGDRVVTCPFCNGKGYRETVEPYPLGEGAEFFDIAEVYPALVFDDGGLMQRQRIMSRRELLDERSMLEALLGQVTVSFATGNWPAVPSEDACSRCACRRDCPLPNQLLPFDAIETREQAEHYALAMDVLERERKDVVKALKARVKSHGPIALGKGMQLNFVPVEVNQTDWNGFRDATAQGRIVSPEEFQSKRIQTSFKAEPAPEPVAESVTPGSAFGDEAPW